MEDRRVTTGPIGNSRSTIMVSRPFLSAVVLTTLSVPFGANGPAFATDRNLLDDALDILNSTAPSTTGDVTAGLSQAEIGDGLIEALQVGTARVVDTVGQVDGFNGDPEIHIPLPDYLQDAQGALDMVGMGELGQDLELKLNRAAETAAPEAREVFLDAISQMTMDDVMAIYEGPQDAATRFFQRTMTPPLTDRMRPIIVGAMSEVGVVQSYDNMVGPYEALPLVPDVKGDISDYTVTQALNGLFHKLAQEEAAIRSNPAARSTDLLKKVFR
jgi:hypothetical protein